MANNKDRILMEAIIIAANRGGLFVAELPNKTTILAKPSGKIQKNMIKIIVGDRVMIEVSPYDMTKGRIVQRTK